MTTRWLVVLPLATAAITLPPVAAAQDGARLEPITVTSPRLERDLQQTPAAVGVVDEEELQQGRQQLQLDESLNRVPGVFFQNRYNFAQNLRLSIRGFGARAPFGVRGIRILVDGIPETLPDGQSQVDAIDLETAESVEVIRGPSSALYGNAAGGVVDIRTKDGPAEPYAELRGTVGSYDFQRYGVMGGGQSGPWNAHISAWDMQYEGYRDQSRTEKRMANAKATYAIDDQRSVTTVFTALDQPVGQDPGGLNRTEVRDNRRQATANAENLDAGQEVEQQRLGLIYRDGATYAGELTLRGFYTRRDFRQQLPFEGPSLIEYDRDFFGIGGEYTDQYTLAGRPATFVAGVESAWQRDARERFNVEDDGDPDEQTQDAVEKAEDYGVFAQTDVAVTDALDITLGGRYDRVRFEIDDRRPDGDGEASGSQRFDEVSGTFGIGLQLHPDHRWYTNVGTAFETPTFTEFYDPNEPDEGFDPGLGPQRAVNLETGLKGFLGDRAQYDVAVFGVRSRDEIVQVDTDPDRFDNAGRTRRVGVEAGLEYFVTPELSFTGSYTWSDYRFRRFQSEDGSEDFRGNRLPGLPEHNLFLEAAWRETEGFYAIADALIVSNVYADNANNERVSGYGVLNARVGTEHRWQRGRVETFVAVNNITNQEYFSNVRVNAGFGRFFEPAPERNFFTGVRARF